MTKRKVTDTPVSPLHQVMGQAASTSAFIGWDSIEVPEGYSPLKDKSYMNPVMVKFFLDKLRGDRKERAAELRSLEQSTVQVMDGAARLSDAVEVAQRLADQLPDRQRAPKLVNLLKKIETVIGMIEKSTPVTCEYGYCVQTGDEIGVERLLAIPHATRSVEAEDKHQAHKRLHNRDARNG